jgi:oxalate decarboxylase/phosphoglucose isomerase-like protein (cupin superfamily)
VTIADNYNAQGPGDAATKEFSEPPPFYDSWQHKEGIPVYESFFIEDLMKVKLDMWQRFGVPAAFVNLADPFICTAMVLEIPPGGTTKAVRHMFETWVFVVKGTGQTLIQQDGVKEQVVDWQTRSLFGPPLNATYQHSNTGSEPVRILMVTNAPLTLNLYHNEKFVFDNPFVFKDRYQGEDEYFDPHHEVLAQRYIRTNMVKDVRDFYLHEWKERGLGARTVFLSMSHHTIGAHVSEFPVGTYKKAHRHGPSAHVIILQGEGFSLNWKEGGEIERVDWRENSVFSPPDMWYHQHFNTGNDTARYLALKSKGAPEHPCRIGAPGPNSDPDFARLHQIESEDEDPAIYDMFADELQRKGIEIAQPRPNYRKK